MAITITPRLGLKKYGLGSDPHPTRAEHNIMIDSIEAGAVFGSSGLLAARPAAGKGRAFYYATDVGPTGAIFFDTGSGWRDVSSVGGVAASGVSIAGASSEGVSTAAARADHVHAIPLATTSAHGAMASTDKALLAGATSAPTANTLVKNDASGRFQAATPSAAADVAPKSYVDAQVATRALSSHTHPWSQVTGTPATYPAAAHTHPWADVTGKPTTFAPSDHPHDAGDVTSGVFAAGRLPVATQSVHGAMSAADKAKLDKASSTSAANTLMMTDAAGRYQSAAPSAAADVANKAYVDAQVDTAAPASHSHTWAAITGKPGTYSPSSHTHDWSDLPAPIELGANVDFNTLTTRNVYHQAISAEAATSLNGPSNVAGLAYVETDGNFVYQWYYEYSSGGRILYRTRYAGSWYAWRALSFDTHGHDTATAAASGFMSANDKAKLDGATSASSGAPGELVARDSGGLFGVATPTSGSHPTTKAYVDTAINGRAAASHSHSWSQITGKPSSFNPSSHTHTTLHNGSHEAYLSSSGAIVAQGIFDNVYTGLPNLYVTQFGTIGRTTNTPADANHNHSASDITSGTLPYARVRGTDEVHARTATNRSVWVDADGRFGQNTSSIRFKENVRDANLDPAAVLRLRPRIYDRKNREEGVNEFGLIAEEVEANVPELALYDRDGVLETVAYEKIAVALLEVVKTQDVALSDLHGRLERAGL